MEVQLKFNTETESIEDLKKLRSWVDDLIKKRGDGQKSEPSNMILTQTATEKVPAQPVSQPKPQNKTRTSGGSSVVPYEDMSGMLSKLASGEKLK